MVTEYFVRKYEAVSNMKEITMAESTTSQSETENSLAEREIESFAPIAATKRIDAMDILRGFALIGILLMNIEFFSRALFHSLTFDLSLTGLDHAAGWLVRCFVEGKFYKLFALLFGMGFAVMLIRAREDNRPFAAWFIRRMMVLLSFGLFHMIFIWGGDILLNYAFTGLVFLGLIYVLRIERLKKYDNPGFFLKLGLIWLVVPFIAISIGGIGYGVGFDHEKLVQRWQEEQKITSMVASQEESFNEQVAKNENSESLLVDDSIDKGLIENNVSLDTNENKTTEKSEDVTDEAVENEELTEEEERQQTVTEILKGKQSMDTRVNKDLAAYTQDSYWKATVYRVEFAKNLVSFSPIFTFTLLLPIFCLGYWLISSGIMRNHREKKHIFKPMAWIGMSLGLILTVGGLIIIQHPAVAEIKIVRWAGNTLYSVGQFVMAAGYLGLIVCLIGTNRGNACLSCLAPLGRMALTNYIMQSVILTSVFYGYAGGLYGQISRAPQMLMVLVIIVFQILFSRWWLNRYQFGPLEWVWRSLTYKRFQPMKINPVSL